MRFSAGSPGLAKRLFCLLFALGCLSPAGRAGGIEKMPKSANDLLLAGKRLELTLKQKMEISKVYQWAASACDWHARSIKEEAVLWQKYREAFSRSLEKGIKILTPRQRKLWRKSQLPDPKTPKPPEK